MGTSSSFGGGKNSNPLIPSWLGGGSGHGDSGSGCGSGSGSGSAGNGGDANQGDGDNGQSNAASANQVTGNRHSEARGNFTSFIKSGGSNKRSLGRALSSYVSKTAGGPRMATQRMLSETLAGAAFAQILSSANTVGIRKTAIQLNLSDLANKPSIEIYAALIDVVCKPGGDLDDSFARAAYSDAIVEVFELGLDDIEQPSLETITIIMERFISNSIFNRILNSIGNKTILLPGNVTTVNNIIAQLKGFIRGAVSDALTQSGANFQATDMRLHIDALYERSFVILQTLAEKEDEE